MKPLFSNPARKWLTGLVVSLVVLAIVLALVSQPMPERPVRDGTGPLAVRLDPGVPAPTTHSPLDWWQANHPTVVNNGDLGQQDCLYCHNPNKSCNNCHSYVGVKQISGQWSVVSGEWSVTNITTQCRLKAPSPARLGHRRDGGLSVTLRCNTNH